MGASNPAPGAVDAFVAERVRPEHREIVALLRDVMRDAVPASREEMRYGLPMWRAHGHLAYLSPSQRGITFGFPYGAAFADPHGVLRGTATHARHLVYRRVTEVDLNVLRACIAEAVAHDAAHRPAAQGRNFPDAAGHNSRQPSAPMTPFDVPPPDGAPPPPDAASPPPVGVPPPVTEPLPADILGAAVLAGLRQRFADQRRLAELALAQTSDEAFFESAGALDPLAVQVKHVAGSLRSRFTDFLTTDGEKPDRDRDREFVIGRGDSRESLTASWDAAWDTLDAAIAGLTPTDLGRTVTIRAEPHTVLDALQRALTHVSYHTGQIVLLAKGAAGDAWRTLSVERGGSEAFNAQMRARFS